MPDDLKNISLENDVAGESLAFTKEYVTRLREESTKHRLTAEAATKELAAEIAAKELHASKEKLKGASESFSSVEEEIKKIREETERRWEQAEQKVQQKMQAADQRVINAELRDFARKYNLRDLDDLKPEYLHEIKVTESGDVEGVEEVFQNLKAKKPYLFDEVRTSAASYNVSPLESSSTKASLPDFDSMSDVEYQAYLENWKASGGVVGR